MSVVVCCDKCGEKGRYREGGDLLPKGWLHVSVNDAGTRSDRDFCDNCAAAIRAAMTPLAEYLR